jgi:hypothetical protein
MKMVKELLVVTAAGMLLSSCVVPVDYYGPHTSGYYTVLPTGYVGDTYWVGGRYYYGGVYHPGRYYHRGRYHDGRYYYRGRYYYGGRYQRHVARHHRYHR